MTTIGELQELVGSFNRARSWESAHTPGALAEAISIEAAELLRCFLWESVPEQLHSMQDPARRAEVESEIADIAIYVLTFCNQYAIDLGEVVQSKVSRNERRFPPPHVDG